MSPQQLYGAIANRVSTRTFNRTDLPDHVETALRAQCQTAPTLCPGVRVLLAKGDPDKVFAFPVYGPPTFLAIVGDVREKQAFESAGYAGEYTILAATAMGLSTCWLMGFVTGAVREIVSPEPEERVIAISPVGFAGRPSLSERTMKTLMRGAPKKALESLLQPGPLSLDQAEPWQRAALEAARLAPSAVNRQPWRFTIEEGRIRVSCADSSNRARTDVDRLGCGIAMAHISIAAKACGISGGWTLLTHPDVGVFSETSSETR